MNTIAKITTYPYNRPQSAPAKNRPSPAPVDHRCVEIDLPERTQVLQSVGAWQAGEGKVKKL